MTRFIATAAAAFAALTLAAAPAMASDPDTAPAAKKVELSGRAKSVKLCRPESKEPGAKVVCKSRGKWIREGKDPLGEY